MQLYGFIKNLKVKGIVVQVVLRPHEISNNYVFIYYEEKNIAMILSVSNYPAVWIVTCPNSIYA